MPDPLRDLERRIEEVAALSDMRNQSLVDALEGMRADVNQLRSDHSTFVTIARFTPLERLFWATITALIVGLVGAAVAILTRG